ncbi:MAG: agmatinase [Bdellovibrionales bacterium]|nr:agmatinase [Bdellovibrionales bacterium]
MTTDTKHPIFLAPEEGNCPIEKASVIVMPLPYEKTTSYKQGTSKGPLALLEASSQVEFFDPELGFEPKSMGIHTDWSLAAMDLEQDPETLQLEIHKQIEPYINEKKFILTLGGEHTITPLIAPPILRAYQDDITVVHIDAHADLKAQYQGSPFSHACAIRRIHGMAPIRSIGIRSLDQEEYRFARDHQDIQTWYEHDLRHQKNWISQVLESISTQHIYLTIDLDGLDPSIMPAVGTPQPGGLLWGETLDLIYTLAKNHHIVSADVNELCPIEGQIQSDFLAAKLCHKIIGYSFASRQKNTN